MRTFALINALGSRWSLNDMDSFFHTMKGLGQGYDTSYTRIGNRFIQQKSSLSQKKITGKIRFRGYSDFSDFSAFIQHKPLTLVYGGFTPENNEYLLDVVVKTLEKSELENGGLQCNINFESLGTYYKIMCAEGGSVITMHSDTVIGAGVRICIQGPCVNPYYRHYLNSIEVCSGRFMCSIPTGHKMIIDTIKLSYEVKDYAEYDNDTDLYGTSDFSTKRFVSLGYGENVLEFFHDGSSALNVKVEAKIEYESV